MQKGQTNRGGFALPTVLIASVVMLIVLAVSVSSVASVRTTLKTQYYEQLAKAAGEAGVAYAKACLAKNSNKPLWTDAKPLKPNTDCAGNELLVPEIQVLAVAGGGGGGYNHGGGGGGGGVTFANNFSVASGQSFSVVVGGGGAGGTSSTNTGSKGGDSSFGGVLSVSGGGGGGSRLADNSVTQATSGGSGGGGAGTIDGGTGQPGAGAAGSSGQGYNGGNGSSGATAGNGGGGGGAGGAGTDASGTSSGAGVSGAGGIGYLSDVSGSVYYYGGGGSGGRWAAGSVGATGLSGGGAGGDADGVAGKPGQANSGGGGGGGASNVPGGGAGGSGVVYVRYANNGTLVATGGTVSIAGPYKVHAFKTVGTSTFTVTAANTSACPSDPRCSVVVNDTLRSSFSVKKPVVDAGGRALTIPNSGYVELLRASTGEVWRTYRQPAVQVAAVPDLCSGAASSMLGWQRAVVSSTQESIPDAGSAQTITLADGGLAAGKMYFRKDFTVFDSGTYNVSVLTTNASTVAAAYVDGANIDTAQGSLASSSLALSAGCHTLTIQLTNKTLTPQPARVTAAVQKNGSSPIVTTDSSWRVSAGSSVHFSEADYYADPSIWTEVTDNSPAAAGTAIPAWSTAQRDDFTQMISPLGNGCGLNCPASSSGYLRDTKDVFVASDTDVEVASLCDDDCTVYMDGDVVIEDTPWSSVNESSLTLTAGRHHFAIRLYNSGAATNPSKAAMSVVDKATGTVLTRTDHSWVGANIWTAGLNATTDDIRSYEDSFRPSPDEIPRPTTADLLIVGGGGGGGSNSGGGGGAGGVIYAPNAQLGVATYTVTIGGGGAGGTNTGTTSAARGQNGGNTVFGSYVAIGGGGGASRDNGPNATSGGSGGAGSGTTVAGREAGASGTSPQGYRGGNGTPADQSVAAKGGGGGGAGGEGVDATNALSGNGGPGFISYITGSIKTYAGGGAGGNTASNGSLGIATDGGVGGSGAAAPANRGGGGAGIGGNSGGSGVVVVRIRTGSMSVTVTGSPAVTSVTIQGVAYTIYTFNASGTFKINSIN